MALETIQEILDSGSDSIKMSRLRLRLQSLFPELAGSKDEQIRKALIENFELLNGKQFKNQKWGAHEELLIDDILTWLEKQGEQKPTDKVEPKFKVGDWITNGDYTWKIVEVKPLDYILQSQDGNIVDDSISHVDEQFHSFTIQDAKDGDVLASELCDSIILFKGIKDNNIDFYCDYDFSKIDIPGDRFAVNNGQHYGSVEDSKDFHPATKEQRDLLFQKMKEAGYEWDDEKKELKKISQRMISAEAKETMYDKPAWSEEDEHRVKDTIYFLDTAKVHYASTVELDACIYWLKSLKQRIGG